MSKFIEQLNKLTNIQMIYESMNEHEQFGLRFGLFPLRIKDRMEQLDISPADPMKYDQIIRAKQP